MNAPAPQTTQPAARPPTALQVVCDGLKQMEPQFISVLPKNVSVEKFTRTALQGIHTHGDKDKLLKADRQSLYNACTKAASDGLQLDGREAALVVFGDVVAYMPMTQGLIKLARNSGEIKNIVAQVVYAKDVFRYDPGVDEKPSFNPDWFNEERGEPVGAYALITLANGEYITSILPKSKIIKIASKSKNKAQYDPGAGLYFDEWWKKTAIKNVLKYAPKSTEIEKVLASDEEEFLDGEGNVVSMPATSAPAKPRKSKAADAVKSTQPAAPSMPSADLLNTATATTAPQAAAGAAAPVAQPQAAAPSTAAPAAAAQPPVQDAEFTDEPQPAAQEQAQPSSEGEEIPLM